MTIREALEEVLVRAQELNDAEERVADAISEMEEVVPDDLDEEMTGIIEEVRKLEPDRTPSLNLISCLEGLPDEE